MLDIKWIRDNPDAFDRALAARGIEPKSAAVISLDEERRGHIGRVQAAQERRNAASKEIGRAMAAKDAATAEALKSEVAALKDFLGHAEEEERRLNKAVADALAVIPNVPLDDVPVGRDEHDNVEYFGRNGTAETALAQRPKKRAYGFLPKEHFELGEALRQMDFEAAVKISGARFVVLKAGLARLERALGQFMLDLHTEEHGYTEVQPPLLVRDHVLYGTGQLPKFHDDLFAAYPEPSLRTNFRNDLRMDRRFILDEVERNGVNHARGIEIGEIKLHDDPSRFWLIPTAEVPLTNLVRESILEEKDLPLRFTALTPCFRSEAGSAGRDTRGMLRQHQFDKVELVSITAPERSVEEHERMLACAEAVLQRLDLHYRVMTLSTGDMGFGAQKTYDIEVWLPGQNTYREISSVSVCGDFQARRMEARYRPAGEKGTRFVHTLNGSGTAVGRCLIAVMETYQNEDGSITVPEALKPYMRGVERIG